MPTDPGAADPEGGEKEQEWDSLRLRLTDYGIGIAIAVILTPLLGFAILMAVSDTFRSWVTG